VIICKKCGNHNQDQETICSSCGAFLEWSGERVTPPAPPPPVAAPPTTTAPPATTAPAPPAASTASPAPPRPAGGGWQPPASVTGRGTPPAPPAPPGPPAPPTWTPQGPPETATGQAPVPPAGPPGAAPPVTPEAREPQAVPPAPPRPRPVVRPVPAPAQPYQPGDLICGQCGAGNRPERHFCRRCGASLAEAMVAQTHTPWYRRLLPARQAPQAPQAGDRRQARSGVGTGALVRSFLAAMVLVVLVGGLLAYAALPGVRSGLNRRLDAVSTEVRRQLGANYQPVRPSQTTASSQLSGHPGPLASDLVSNDYWAADTARDPQPTLNFTFASPTDLDYVLVTPGAAGADYARMARPRTVELVYSDGSGEQLVLKDDPKATGYVIHARQVRSVSMRIADVYPTSQSTTVAIVEVEFFRLG
jgi:hypothetical protein